jgi:hypothetical protein
LIFGALYLIAVAISPLFLAILVGWDILRRRGGLYAALLLGVLLLILLRLVPVLGFVVSFVATLVGLGAMILALQARTAHPFFHAPAEQEPPPQAT